MAYASNELLDGSNLGLFFDCAEVQNPLLASVESSP